MSYRRDKKTAPKATITKRLAPFTDLVKMRAVIDGIRNVDDAIRVMGLSNKTLGEWMGEYRDGKEFFAKSTISHWRNQRKRYAFKMKREHWQILVKVIGAWTRDQMRREDVTVNGTHNSPLHCWMEIRRACGHWEKIDLRRKNARVCEECGR